MDGEQRGDWLAARARADARGRAYRVGIRLKSPTNCFPACCYMLPWCSSSESYTSLTWFTESPISTSEFCFRLCLSRGKTSRTHVNRVWSMYAINPCMQLADSLTLNIIPARCFSRAPIFVASTCTQKEDGREMNYFMQMLTEASIFFSDTVVLICSLSSTRYLGRFPDWNIRENVFCLNVRPNVWQKTRGLSGSRNNGTCSRTGNTKFQTVSQSAARTCKDRSSASFYLRIGVALVPLRSHGHVRQKLIGSSGKRVYFRFPSPVDGSFRSGEVYPSEFQPWLILLRVILSPPSMLSRKANEDRRQRVNYSVALYERCF